VTRILLVLVLKTCQYSFYGSDSKEPNMNVDFVSPFPTFYYLLAIFTSAFTYILDEFIIFILFKHVCFTWNGNIACNKSTYPYSIKGTD